MKLSTIKDCYMIAEIGVNHGGSVETALKMIDAAKDSGADAVKFQTFKASSLVSLNTPKVEYQMSTTDKSETHYEMIKALEFKYEDHKPVFDYCKSKEIDFISTPYDIESAKFLDDLGVETFKTASADIVDLPLHEFLASTNKNVIISTGMSTIDEIKNVLSIYSKKNSNNIAILHCVANYPCAYKSLNLNVIKTMQDLFGITTGYSDHAIGPYPAVAAIAMGAKIIEKHFTLNKDMPGPDHKASITPNEFRDLVTAVRVCEESLGKNKKFVQDEEKQMREVSRKSLFFNKDIQKGEIINENDLVLKRPGTGIYSIFLKDVIGKILLKDVYKDKMVEYGDFE